MLAGDPVVGFDICIIYSCVLELLGVRMVVLDRPCENIIAIHKSFSSLRSSPPSLEQ